jgi:SAM-dependent methyltransferase
VGATVNETVDAYDRDAAAYARASPPVPAAVLSDMVALAERLGPGALVLEVGSGGGRDALLLEGLGLRVRRTDVTPGFVALLREQGHHADLLDPLVDDLVPPDGPSGGAHDGRHDGRHDRPHDRAYDGVWANASLLHVRREDLPTVLARLAAATREGGVLRASFKEGDGDGWSTHGAVRRRRHFTYWGAGDLETVLAASGWTDVAVRTGVPGSRGESWLEVSAVRARVGP